MSRQSAQCQHEPVSNENDLEAFRREWQQDVQARARQKGRGGHAEVGPSSDSGRVPLCSKNAIASVPVTKVIKSVPPPATSKPKDFGWEYATGTAYHDVDDSVEGGRTLANEALEADSEPETALEIYESAERRERQGELGESVRLYRRAFKLDPEVDKLYKNKHFPAGSYKAPVPVETKSAPLSTKTVPKQTTQGLSSSLLTLMEDVSAMTISGAPPPTDLSPAPPCPIATLPEELLVEILRKTADVDMASFVRLAQVCKRFAVLVATETSVWKRIVHGQEYGFAAMHYQYACQITGEPLGDGLRLGMDDEPGSPVAATFPSSHTIPLTPTYPTYRSMFRTRPRIRFNGLYISTVEYNRAGNRSNTLSWGDPVHTVTYYRYLRFFRDGTCISLQTTTQPREVVPFLQRRNLKRDNYPQGAPWAFMRDALVGRWRLTGPDAPFQQSKPGPLSPQSRTTAQAIDAEGEAPNNYADEKEGEVEIQTEGSVARYTFHMRLAFGSANAQGAKRGGQHGNNGNNKLSWKGFWSYNVLSDDWAEFALRNDRAFIWSRVRSYGHGWPEDEIVMY